MGLPRVSLKTRDFGLWLSACAQRGNIESRAGAVCDGDLPTVTVEDLGGSYVSGLLWTSGGHPVSCQPGTSPQVFR